MVNAVKFCWPGRVVDHRPAVLLLGLVVLTAAAWLRGAEYDEQYTLFLTAGIPRPDWPDAVFPAGMISAAQAGHAGLAEIARDLRATDVHPPLYFWAMAAWREVFGPGLFAARVVSVLCGVVSLALVGGIARRCGVRPVAAMLVTLGCYGFVYTNAIARGFAPAQMFGLAGVALLLGRRPLLAGTMFGAACGCNYLAVFVAVGAIVSARARRSVVTAVPFLVLDTWFFAAQHGSRAGQFPPFAVGRSLVRLAEYQVGAVFGGLPLYVDGGLRSAVGAGVGVVAVAVALAVALTRPWRSDMRIVLAAALAPPAGLLLLGAVFDNTPIELRYLSFGLPFVGVIVAGSGYSQGRTTVGRPITVSSAGSAPASLLCRGWALGPRPRAAQGQAWAGHPRLHHPPYRKSWVAGPSPAMTQGQQPGAGKLVTMRTSDPWTITGFSTAAGRAPALLALVLALQTVSIAGLLLSPRTMQPARAAAAEAARFAGDGIVLLPRGNDGVGIVGAFGIEAPPALPLLLVRAGDPIATRVAQWHRVVLATLGQDRDSRATLPAVRGDLAAANWRLVANGSNVEVYERR